MMFHQAGYHPLLHGEAIQIILVVIGPIIRNQQSPNNLQTFQSIMNIRKDLLQMRLYFPHQTKPIKIIHHNTEECETFFDYCIYNTIKSTESAQD